MFVDGYQFKAYESAGFGRFDQGAGKESAKQVKNMSAPDMDGGIVGWWNYLTNVAKLSPLPKDMKFGEFPEGVVRLGGTFVVNGDNILYRWSDRLPGDHPNIEQVLNIAKQSISDN